MSAPRVLIVEDDQDIRESLVEFLESHGYLVVSASHGREALDGLLRSPDRPCLILLDLMMPVMDGKGFRDEQLRYPELSGIPVLLISAYRDVDDRAADLGRLPFLRKPFELNELLKVVENACRPASGQASGRKKTTADAI